MNTDTNPQLQTTLARWHKVLGLVRGLFTAFLQFCTQYLPFASTVQVLLGATILMLPLGFHRTLWVEGNPLVAAGVYHESYDVTLWVFELLVLTLTALLAIRYKKYYLSIIILTLPCLYLVSTSFTQVYPWLTIGTAGHWWVALLWGWCLWVASGLFYVEHSYFSEVNASRRQAMAGKLEQSPSPQIFHRLIGIPLTIAGVLQSVLAIGQTLMGKSWGYWWLGESVIGTNLPGVAKVEALGTVFLRGYGTFTHPNVLGSFLVLVLGYYLWQSTKADVPRGTIRPNAESHDRLTQMFQASAVASAQVDASRRQAMAGKLEQFKTVCSGIIIGLLTSGILVSGSRVAIVALIALLVAAYVPRGTIADVVSGNVLENRRVRLAARFAAARKRVQKLFILGFAFVGLFPMAFLWISQWQSVQERLLPIKIAWLSLISHPLVGVGAGQLVDNFVKLVPSLPVWQYQPPHNVPLYFLAENGLIGFLVCVFAAVLYWAWYRQTQENVPRGTLVDAPYMSSQGIRRRGKSPDQVQSIRYFWALILALVIGGLFDHYYYDLEQGRWLLVLYILILTNIHKYSK